MRRDIVTTCTIPAPRSEVWGKLADLSGWAGWNASVSIVSGKLETGTRLQMRITLPGRRPRTLSPEVMRVLPAEELSWIIRTGPPGVLDCEHRLLLELPESGDREQTLLVQRASLSGLLLPLFWYRLRPGLTASFHQSNRGLLQAVQAETDSTRAGHPETGLPARRH